MLYSLRLVSTHFVLLLARAEDDMISHFKHPFVQLFLFPTSANTEESISYTKSAIPPPSINPARLPDSFYSNSSIQSSNWHSIPLVLKIPGGGWSSRMPEGIVSSYMIMKYMWLAFSLLFSSGCPDIPGFPLWGGECSGKDLQSVGKIWDEMPQFMESPLTGSTFNLNETPCTFFSRIKGSNFVAEFRIDLAYYGIAVYFHI